MTVAAKAWRVGRPPLGSWMRWIALALAACLYGRLGAYAPQALAQSAPLAQIYKLESVEISGSTRLDSTQIATELGLLPGTPLDDELVMNTRSRLLGLGLFKSVILMMRKGSQPGYARLVVEVEDDPGVLTDWALGGELGVSMTESNAPSSVDSDNAPMDYRLGLVGRNLLGQLHRGSLFIELDSNGELRQGQGAYGLPRFTREHAQFDAEIAVVDPYYRYLDALGFGGRGQGLWSRSLAGYGELQYGAAMYVNKAPRFAVPGYPNAVAGPKIAFLRETRLRGFFPGEGHRLGASLLVAPTDTEHSVLELSAAQTWDFARLVYLTLESRVLAVGAEGYGARAEGRIDIPFGKAAPDADQAAAFLRLRGGHDKYDDVDLLGSAAIAGVRYHSSGFIAELAIKITRSPEHLAPKLRGFREAP